MINLFPSEFIPNEEFYLTDVENKERSWINSLSRPFSGHYVAENKIYEVFMLDPNNHHPEFNPFCSMIFYFQYTHVGEKMSEYNSRGNQIHYIHQPMFKPNGKFSVDNGSQTMTCLDGYLHDSSGNPAMISELFGPAYYLHGSNYEPIEYFRLMEDQHKWFPHKYPNYNPKKYLEYMANILGQKSNL